MRVFDAEGLKGFIIKERLVEEIIEKATDLLVLRTAAIMECEKFGLDEESMIKLFDKITNQCTEAQNQMTEEQDARFQQILNNVRKDITLEDAVIAGVMS